jgi:ABC-type transporter Mla maintaining outer membrane lipid asymmetry ATPase subunit MlaF
VKWSASPRRRRAAELSGGCREKRSPRALAFDPEIVFLDEPTSGLDPISASDFDTLISTLQQTLGLTVFMVTHDLESLYTVCDRVAVLADGKVVAVGPISAMLESEHPWVKTYFHNNRAGPFGHGELRSTMETRALCSDRRVRTCRDWRGIRPCLLAAQYQQSQNGRSTGFASKIHPAC